MRQNFFRYWLPTTAVLALVLSSFSALSPLWQTTNKEMLKENERMMKKFPEGKLQGYMVTIAYVLETSTSTDGLPGQTYIRDRVMPPQYMVLPELTSNLIEEHYPTDWKGWQIEDIIFKKVAQVRRPDPEEIPPPLKE